jgi:hypothetical protein
VTTAIVHLQYDSFGFSNGVVIRGVAQKASQAFENVKLSVFR